MTPDQIAKHEELIDAIATEDMENMDLDELCTSMVELLVEAYQQWDEEEFLVHVYDTHCHLFDTVDRDYHHELGKILGKVLI